MSDQDRKVYRFWPGVTYIKTSIYQEYFHEVVRSQKNLNRGADQDIASGLRQASSVVLLLYSSTKSPVQVTAGEEIGQQCGQYSGQTI